MNAHEYAILNALAGPANYQQRNYPWERRHRLAPVDQLAPTSAVFAGLISWIGLVNARAQGWCV